MLTRFALSPPASRKEPKARAASRTHLPALAEHAFLRNLPQQLVSAIEDMSLVTTVPKDFLLFSESEPATSFHLLYNGLVKLTVNSASAKSVIVRIAAPGELLDAPACLFKKPHSVTAEIMVRSQVAIIERKQFMRLVDSNPELSFRLAECISSEFVNACAVVAQFGLMRSAESKVANLLVHLVEQAGLSHAAEPSLLLRFTQQDMAQMSGASRESVNRALNHFRRTNVIEIRKPRLIIRNLALLREISEAETPEVGERPMNVFPTVRDQSRGVITSDLGVAGD